MSNNVTSVHNFSSPFSGIWETDVVGFTSPDAATGPGGTCAPTTILGYEILSVGYSTQGPQNVFGDFLLLVMPANTPQNFFGTVTVTKTGGTPHNYDSSAATFYIAGANGQPWTSGAKYPTWVWPMIGSANTDFAVGVVTVLSFGAAIPTPGGKGDIMNPLAWETVSTGKLPPSEYDGIPGGGFV